MYCVHLCPNPPELPVAGEEYHWLPVADGKVLLIHPDCHKCRQPVTRLPHVLHEDVVGDAMASALVDYGVKKNDTMLQAMFKVAPHWPVAWP